MRRLILPLLLLTAGCDTVGVDPEPYDGVIEVSLSQDASVHDLALRLVAVDDASCSDPLATSSERGPLTRTVTVEGIVRPQGPTCLALIPPVAVVSLDLGPELPSGYAVEVAHAGAVDLYSLDLTAPTPTLTAVRTSTTRLAE